jgi:hypothetical protein
LEGQFWEVGLVVELELELVVVVEVASMPTCRVPVVERWK